MKEYFHNKISSFKGDSKRLWTFLNGYIHRQNDKNDIVKSLKVNGVDVTEKKKIADNLDLYFSTVGKEFTKNLSTNNNSNYNNMISPLTANLFMEGP